MVGWFRDVQHNLRYDNGLRSWAFGILLVAAFLVATVLIGFGTVRLLHWYDCTHSDVSSYGDCVEEKR